MNTIIRFYIVAAIAAFIVACGSGGNGTSPALSGNARLVGLSISVAEFDQIFQPNQQNYTATVSLLRSTTAVTPVTEDANASVTVDGAPVISGTASGDITLDEGINTITVVVTAEDGVTTGTYTIDITRQTAASFAQQAYIKTSNTDSSDQFGNAVVISGDTLAVGAWSEDSAATGIDGDQSDNAANDSGAVYVFTRDPAGVWSQQAYIKASNTGPGDPRTATGDNFGNSIALSGDTLAVAAWGEDSSATGIDGDQSDEDGEDSGAVYVFTRNGSGLWTQQAYIKASNTDIRDSFGHSVALAGDTLAVSASWESSDATGINGDQNNNNADFSGAVYIFTRDGAGVWTQHTYVKASNTKAADEFGWAVDLSTDSLAVGARGEQGLSGAVYLFSRNGDGAWSQQAYIKASNAGERDQFGWSVALSGDALVVGARLEDSAATGIGGDPADDSAEDSGAAYLFMRDAAGTWLQQAYIKASNTNAGDWFGGSVAVNADALVIGANFEDSAATGINGDQSDNSAAAAGAVYVY